MKRSDHLKHLDYMIDPKTGIPVKIEKEESEKPPAKPSRKEKE